jgi:hypothetical protein
MSRPEEFREDVYLAENFHADALRNELSGRGEMLRMPEDHDSINDPARDPVRDAFRETARREPLHRELSRELGRALGPDLGRDLTRETLDRDTSVRQPLNHPHNQPLTREPVGRALGSPLPTGSGAAPAQDMHKTATPPGRALSPATPPMSAEESSALQRAMGLLKHAAPFVARLLPLLEGNVTGALANLMSPRPHAPAAPVDLTPVHNQLSEMQLQHNDLRVWVQDQNTSLKRVEDQLELVREATDRNTLEQQELIEDLKAVGHKVSLIAVGLSILLVLSVVMNLVLYMYIKRVLP